MVLNISNLKTKTPVYLAPMAGITDTPSRSIFQKFNPSLVVSEMIASSPSDKQYFINTVKSNLYKLSKQDVVSFFIENPDSFPKQDPVVDFSLIQQPVELSVSTKDSIFTLAKTIKDSLSAGLLDFSVAAKRYSQDPGSSSNGGSLGYTSRGSLLMEYEQVAFNLEKNSLSDPVESAFGFHIIQLVDKLGEKIKTNHILFSLKPGPSDLKKIINKIKNQKNIFFNDPASFDSLALSYFEKHKNLSGYYTNFKMSSAPLFLQKKLSVLKNYSFSEIFEEEGFVFLLYKYKEKKPDKITLEKDWALIEQIALAHKNYTDFKEWIKNKKRDIYIKKFYK